MTSPPDAAPSSARRLLALAMGAFGTMLDVALVVLGTALLGLALAVLLDGFELVGIGFDLSTGALLGSGLVIGIIGGFSIGVASEGPLGRSRRLVGYNELHVLVARLVASVVVGGLLLVARDFLEEIALELPVPFQIGVEAMRAVAVAGMTAVPLLAVPVAWLIRTGRLGRTVALDGDIPLLFLVWAITTMILL